MIKNLKIGKKLIAGLLVAATISGVSTLGYKVHRNSEVNRVKGYLEDFKTEEGYVDLSKISQDYKIKSFKGEYLKEALEETSTTYVRISHNVVFDDKHVEAFSYVDGIDYDTILWSDMENDYYAMCEPIRMVENGSVVYIFPEGFEKHISNTTVNPIRYDMLDSYDVDVFKNDEDYSYNLELKHR